MKGARIHLDLFKVYRDLAESRSFSKTATRNYLTQSAISQQIAFLERHFGKKLVDRGRGRFSLTEEGQLLLEASRSILATYQDVKDSIRNPGEISGSVKVETVYSIGLHQLTLFVKTFMRRHKLVNLHLEYNRSNRIYSDVLRGVCDLGIVAYPPRHPLIKIIPFKKEKLAVVCSVDDLLARKRKIRPKDLEQRRFIAFDPDIPTGRAIEDLLRKMKVHVDVVQEFDNIETLKRSVEIGAGISILPENTVTQEVKNKTLVCIPFSGGPILRPTGIIYRRRKKLSRAAREFIKWLTQ